MSKDEAGLCTLGAAVCVDGVAFFIMSVSRLSALIYANLARDWMLSWSGSFSIASIISWVVSRVLSASDNVGTVQWAGNNSYVFVILIRFESGL